ncbi:DUF222 domain-containing protein, partial [Blastococcus tunisiensis]
MFDQSRLSVEDRPSVLEALLRATLAGRSAPAESYAPRRRVLLDSFSPHISRPAMRASLESAAAATEPQPSAAGQDTAAGAEPESGAPVGTPAADESDAGSADAGAAEAAESDAGSADAGAVEAGAADAAEVGAAAAGAGEVGAADPGGAQVEPECAALAGLLEAGAAHLAEAGAAYRAQGRQAARQARALAAFAAARPAAAMDRPDGEVGAAAAASRAARPAALTGVSEWAVDEVMVALALSSRAASTLLGESVVLVEQFPATVAAVEAGTISWAHARMLAHELSLLTDDALRASVEARLLAGAGGRTVGQLRVSAQRAVLRADASAAVRRLAAAIKRRAVRAYPDKDGMGTLSASMPLPVLRACEGVLRQYARECTFPGDERSTDQRMLDCLVDLLLRPDAAGRPPVQAHLTIVASAGTLAGGDEPGEVDGQPVPAALVRELAYALGLLPRPQPPADAGT